MAKLENNAGQEEATGQAGDAEARGSELWLW